MNTNDVVIDLNNQESFRQFRVNIIDRGMLRLYVSIEHNSERCLLFVREIGHKNITIATADSYNILSNIEDVGCINSHSLITDWLFVKALPKDQLYSTFACDEDIEPGTMAKLVSKIINGDKCNE